jgi:hypothetical protein
MAQPTRLCRGRPGKALDSLVVLAMEKVQWHAGRRTCGPNGERRRSLERCTAGFRSPQCPLWVSAYFSGIASASVHGWLWLVAAFLGSVLGTYLRPWFGLSVEGNLARAQAGATTRLVPMAQA